MAPRQSAKLATAVERLQQLSDSSCSLLESDVVSEATSAGMLWRLRRVSLLKRCFVGKLPKARSQTSDHRGIDSIEACFVQIISIRIDICLRHRSLLVLRNKALKL